MRQFLYFAPVALLLGLAAWLPRPVAADAQTTTEAQKAEFFQKQVWPILQKNCVVCHSGESGGSGKLDMTAREKLLKGGVSGATVVPGDGKTSILMRAVRYEDRRAMPPQGKLPAAQIEILAKWVEMGAPYAGDTHTDAHSGPPQVNAKNKKFWSFQPVLRPDVPFVNNFRWPLNPIDNFVADKLDKSGFLPAPDAPRAQWIRRAYYDVIGLPPTPADVAAFVADKSPNAHAKVVDRLLASPQYGERWARHWLDLVRYAETNSFERDGDKPFVWRYRDYVIRSFNSDKPYSQFLTEQLAGDELPTVTPDSLIATGYYRLGQWDDEPADPLQAKFDDLDDILSTTGQTFLGLTVGCARCHDHKIDPMPQKDYHRMLSFFENIRRYGVRDDRSVRAASLRSISSPAEQARFAAERDVYDTKRNALNKRVETVENLARPTFENVEKEEFRDDIKRPDILKKRIGTALTQAQYDDWQVAFEARRVLEAQPPRGLEMALVISEQGRKPAEPSRILMRGNPHSPGDTVTPGFPSILSPPEPIIVPPADGNRPTTGRRLALARWLASSKNPLTARVMANRVWQYHFGRGIVRSTSNFGFLGTAPTHPELLDYLATELVKNGWRLKPLHRQILLSRTYRMSSQPHTRMVQRSRAKDPENDLLHRFDMRRLEAEEIRDSLLAVTGTLNPKMFGQSVVIKIPAEVLAGQSVPGAGWQESPMDEQRRRSVYVKVKRSLPVPLFASFDAADVDATCPVRFATTQPTQALGMLNGAFVNEQARELAEATTRAIPAADDARRIRFVLRQVLQRNATPQETARGVKLLNDLRTRDTKSDKDALRSFCLVALNLNEFVFLD